ncbi:QRFP-like peptide receptor [Branchiostoma lanceolatum]|uniref:QRFP-like peptide receptor n=1 Tax=Branchiostoma lanceolatum TaxID=7740 RepID=UPI0034537CA3
MTTVHVTAFPTTAYPPNHNASSMNLSRDELTMNGTDFMDDEGFCGAACILTMYEISLPVIISGALTFVLGIIGNSLVIFSVCRNRCLRTGINFYLVSLATADLLTAAVFVPVETVEFFLSDWQLGWFTCKVVAFVHLLTRTCSALTLTAIAVERRHVITQPLKAKSSATTSRTRRLISAVWVASLLLSVPKLVGQRLIAHEVPFDVEVVYHCQMSWDSTAFQQVYAVYLMVVLFVTPVLGMLVSHIRAIYKLRGDSKANSDFLNGTGGKGGKRASKAQVTRILVAVVVLYAIFWGPVLTLNLTMKFDLVSPYTQAVYAMRLAFTQLSLLHSCVNPIAYAFVSRNFRLGLARALRSLTHHGRQEDSASGGGSHSGHHPPPSHGYFRQVPTVPDNTYNMWLWQISRQLQERGPASEVTTV